MAFVRQETIAELWLRQILKTHNYLSETNQIFVARRTLEEEQVVSKVMEGNIRYCMEIMIKAHMKKKKNMAMVHCSSMISDVDSEDTE